MLAVLLDEGVEVDAADALLGTSAGAVVAAQLAGDTPIDVLYERQRGGVPFEVPKGLSWRMVSAMTRHGLMAGSAEDFGRRIGRAATDLGQEEAELRRRVIEGRLPTHHWGSRDVRLVVVDADTGACRLLSRADDVPLVDAVMASCAIPLVWPVVPIGSHRYMDGGMRSPVNLDLAPGDGPVVALAATTRWHRWARLDDQRDALGDRRPLALLTMSREVRSARGRNPLRLEIVPAVAAARREQGRRDAALVRAATRP